jgi:hypothetical protein
MSIFLNRVSEIGDYGLHDEAKFVGRFGRDKQPQLARQDFDIDRQNAAEVAIYLIRNLGRSGWFQAEAARASQIGVGKRVVNFTHYVPQIPRYTPNGSAFERANV